MNKLAITSVIAYYMDQNWALREVQHAFNEVEHLFCSCFESGSMIKGQGPTYWSKVNRTLEGRA